jgi:integrase
MSIKKVGPNLWQIKVSVRVPGKVDPVKKQERLSGTKTDAECRQADIIRQLKESGSLICSPNIRTFREAVDLYAAKLRAEGRLSKHWERKVNFIRREFGHLSLDVMPDYFDAWTRNRANTPCGGRMLAPATINRPVDIVRAVYNHLLAREVVQRNPITKIRFPRHREKPRDRYLSQEERLRLFNAIRARRPQMLPLIQYMMRVPCRVSELLSARREQYVPFTNTIYIPDSKAKIPINKPIPDEMAEYFRSIPEDCPWLFYWTDRRGRYHPFRSIYEAWCDSVKMAGLEDINVHDLRHIAATDLYEAGNNERMIADVAGWTTPNMLSTYYHKNGLRSAQRVVFKPPVEPAAGDSLMEKSG